MIKLPLLLAIVLFAAGIFLLMSSYHNLDLAYNAKNQGIAYDINPFGIIKTIDLIHLQGLQEIILALFCFFGSTIILLSAIFDNIIISPPKKKHYNSHNGRQFLSN